MNATTWQTIGILAACWTCVALIIPADRYLDRRAESRAVIREATRICREAAADAPSSSN
ncbi:hypothetical protein LN042_11565 [Kitasatospora sp. RB6PN24]|uniref:hypothetical protein n=1 Tax=Kitasatospora humi TaxID=2893891 RepID=UPI001E52B95C|nr:hypothetical protein [Kitasatospora humi]MCC9307727.1 hypothetical protein [Kitasatospora humi]